MLIRGEFPNNYRHGYGHGYGRCCGDGSGHSKKAPLDLGPGEIKINGVHYCHVTHFEIRRDNDP